MIYTLEYDYHNGMYETDWLDTLKRTGLEYKTLVNEMLTGEGAISNKRYLESNIDYLQNILTEDDYLLMDSAYINENIDAHSMSLSDAYKLIKEKLKYKKIIIFHPDNGEPLIGDDVHFINPQYNIDWDSDKCQSHYNIYINNTGKNKNRWLNMLISQRFSNMLRYKHFQFTNGVFKEHRTLLYGYLKKDGYLDKCFSSYVAYNIGNKIPTYDEHFESLKPNRLTNDDYNELVKDLPLILDCEWSGNVDQDSTVIPYSSNSYFHLVGCTNFNGYMGERFNDTYKHSLLTEQKDLLSNFIVSFSDNGLGLKCFLNEEIGRLKEAVNVEIEKDSTMKDNFLKVKEKLDSYVKRPIDSSMVEEVFYIQDLLAEVKRNGD